MKIATWNVNSIKVRLEHVLSWLKTTSPDILALQEVKCLKENFPLMEFEAAGYHVMVSGQKSYNGVAVLSRHEMEEVQTGLSTFDDPQKRVLFVSTGKIRIMNVYVPNGSEVGSDKYLYKLKWLAALAEDVKKNIDLYPEVAVLGDFNIAPDDIDVHDPEKWRGRILCSADERSALDKIMAAGLSDIFRELNPESKSFSWWDYRQGAFRRDMGLRIDLILTAKNLANRAQSCVIDKEPRRWERPSDHVPVVFEFD